MATKKPDAKNEGLTEHDNETVGSRTGGLPYMVGDGTPEAKLGIDPQSFEAQERYGVQGTPIPADEAWVAPITNFSKKDVRAEKWKLINYGNKSITFVNTFDGMAGANFKQDVATFPLDAKKTRKQIAGHQKVDVNDCPVAIPAKAAEKAGVGNLVKTTDAQRDAGDPARTAETAEAK